MPNLHRVLVCHRRHGRGFVDIFRWQVLKMPNCPIHNVEKKETNIGNGKRAVRCPKCQEDKLAALRELMKWRPFDIARPDDWERFKL